MTNGIEDRNGSILNIINQHEKGTDMTPYINGKPLENHEGFYIVPSAPEYAVNREGDVINLTTGNKITRRTINDTEVLNNLNYHMLGNGLGIHRAVAEVFCPVPEEIKNEVLLVNHINGIKFDNRASNLEWVTYSGNILHAYKTGLRKDNVPLLCKDFETGIITEFYSMQECARFIKRNASIIHGYLKSPNKHIRLISNRYSVIKPGEQWPDVNMVKFNQTGCQRDWVVFDKNKNTYYIFPSINNCADYMEIKAPGLAKRFRDHPDVKEQSFCNGRYTVSTLEDFHHKLKELRKTAKEVDKRKEIHEARAKNHPGVIRPPVPIKVLDRLTNETKEYTSSEEFCNTVLNGVKKNTFQKHLWKHGNVYKDRWEVTYLK